MKKLYFISIILFELLFNFYYGLSQPQEKIGLQNVNCNPSYCITYLSTGMSSSTNVIKDLETEIFAGNGLLGSTALYMQDLHFSIKANENTSEVKEIKIEAFTKLPDGSLMDVGIITLEYVPPVSQNQIISFEYVYSNGLCIQTPVILRLKIGFNCSIFMASTVQNIFTSQ